MQELSYIMSNATRRRRLQHTKGIVYIGKSKPGTKSIDDASQNSV